MPTKFIDKKIKPGFGLGSFTNVQSSIHGENSSIPSATWNGKIGNRNAGFENIPFKDTPLRQSGRHHTASQRPPLPYGGPLGGVKVVVPRAGRRAAFRTGLLSRALQLRLWRWPLFVPGGVGIPATHGTPNPPSMCLSALTMNRMAFGLCVYHRRTAKSIICIIWDDI